MFNKKIIQILNREEGSGLIMALMTLMVLSVLGISLGMITVNGFRLSHINRDSTSVYYIAEAGANQAFEDIRSGVMGLYSEETNSSEFLNKVENTYLGLTKDYTDFEPQNGKVPKATIEVVEGEGENEYILRSTGTIGNASRTVEKPFGVNWVNNKVTKEYVANTPLEATVVARNELNIPNGATITGIDDTPGSVYYDSTKTENLSLFNSNSSTGLNIEIFLPNGASREEFNSKFRNRVSNGDVTFNKRGETAGGNSRDLNWDDYEELLDEFPVFDILKEEKKTTFDKNTINTEGGVKRILVEDLDLSNGLTIEGDGRIDFYVTNTLTLGGDINKSSNGNTDNARRLQIFHKGKNINFVNSLNFEGTLFSKNAPINLPSHSTINGVMITGGKAASNSDTTFNMGHITGQFLILVPNGTLRFGNSGSGNKISGIIVANKIEFPNNITVHLDNTYLTNFPLVLPGFADDEFNENGEVIEPGSILEVR